MAEKKVYALLIQGLVQGVGFRPFIYRIAKEMRLKGCVMNMNNGVRIFVVATSETVDCFIDRIQREKPSVSSIHHLTYTPTDQDISRFDDFTISSSLSSSEEVTQVSPDIAVCSDCMRDRITQLRRLGHPFINCTHCGPRFSIIRDLPYDRERTMMAGFEMCEDCQREYKTMESRRFHAQPIACDACGPIYYATYEGKVCAEYRLLLRLAARMLLKGEVIAVKGIGGYHLVCDALNERAVTHLREIKNRDAKPFAVMFRDIEHLRVYTSLNKIEEQCLCSWRRPIVLLNQRRPLASEVNPNMRTLGCMLPYMPIQYDLFAHTSIHALVMTSANVSDLPIAITEKDVEAQLVGKVDFILHHNRPIYNRVDDSVLQVYGERPCLIRRSRGYVPEPLFTDTNVEGIWAFGAEKVNTFAIGKHDTIIQSQYIGDLKNWETFRFYTESMEHFRRLFRFNPHYLVCDLHPDYLSSQEAERLSKELSLPLFKVQHHHAHAVACMLEYGLKDPVLAIVMDGTGLGDDGKIWGGEFFLCDRSRYHRLSHFEYVPLPGGDKAAEEPWRMLVSYLWHYFKDCPSGIPYPEDFVERIGWEKIRMLERMMERGVNAIDTSSGGRLFDAVSSLLGICDFSSHQSEAPILLEQAALDEINAYPYPLSIEGENISFHSLFEYLLHDKANKVPVSLIAARFHTTLASLFLQKACLLMKRTSVSQVVISGGCFQNKMLTEVMRKQFASAGVPLYIPSRIPCNDGGIAVGQLTIVSEKEKQGDA